MSVCNARLHWVLAVPRCLAAQARPCEIDGGADQMGHQFSAHVSVAGDIRVAWFTSEFASIQIFEPTCTQNTTAHVFVRIVLIPLQQLLF